MSNTSPTRVLQLGRDFESIRTEIINRIARKDTSLTQFTPSDPGTAIIDGVAEVADMINYYIDMGKGESYIATCKQKDSLLAHARSASYYVKGVQPPVVQVLIKSSSKESTFDRKQITLDGAPYAIISPVELASRNSYEFSATAYNGTLTSVWKSVTQLDIADPTVVVGLASEVAHNGMEVYLVSTSDTVEKLRKREWYLTREGDNAVVVIRANKITSSTVEKVLVKFLSITVGEFHTVDEGVAYTDSDGIVFTTTEGSTSGSGEEDYEKARRGIISEGRIVNAVVSLSDYESLAMQDPEVDKAKAFDYNTPSVIEVADTVIVYLKMMNDSSEVPDSVITRLEEELASRSTVVGLSHEWRIAEQVEFDVTANVYAYSTDDVEGQEIETQVAARFDNLDFYQLVTPGMIESYIKSLSPFIARVELVGFSTISPSKIQIPVLRNVAIKVLRYEDLKSGY